MVLNGRSRALWFVVASLGYPSESITLAGQTNKKFFLLGQAFTLIRDSDEAAAGLILCPLAFLRRLRSVGIKSPSSTALYTALDDVSAIVGLPLRVVGVAVVTALDNDGSDDRVGVVGSEVLLEWEEDD